MITMSLSSHSINITSSSFDGGGESAVTVVDDGVCGDGVCGSADDSRMGDKSISQYISRLLKLDDKLLR